MTLSKARIFKIAFSLQGSVLPFAGAVALPCATIACLMKLTEIYNFGHLGHIVRDWNVDSAGLTTFTGSLSFLIIFRTSHSYQRYWQGCDVLQKMTAAFFDSASNITAFLKMSKAEEAEKAEFRNTILTLYSLLTAMCLLDLTGKDNGTISNLRLMSLEVFDGYKLSTETLDAVRHSRHRTALAVHWIQSYIISAHQSGLLNVPPPILTRAFHELGEGMSEFEDGNKLHLFPFPFPYAQATFWLLVFHWFLAPLTICTWTHRPFLAFVFTFAAIFIFWALFAIAEELENPYGDDDDDLDLAMIQQSMNRRLHLLLSNGAELIPSFRDESEWEGLASKKNRDTLVELFSEEIACCSSESENEAEFAPPRSGVKRVREIAIKGPAAEQGGLHAIESLSSPRAAEASPETAPLLGGPSSLPPSMAPSFYAVPAYGIPSGVAVHYMPYAPQVHMVNQGSPGASP